MNNTFTFNSGGNLYVSYSGQGNDTVKFSADENTSGNDRSKTLTFTTYSNNTTVERNVIQEGFYFLNTHTGHTQEEDIGFMAAVQYMNGVNVSQNFECNNNVYKGNSGNLYTNNTTNCWYNLKAGHTVGNEYVLYVNYIPIYARVANVNISTNFPYVNLCKVFYGFANCTNITVSGVTNVTNVQGLAFNCHSITTFSISNFNTSLCNDFTQMFGNCSLSNYSFLNAWNTINVINFGYMFNNCHSLTNINFVNKWDVSKATCFSGMFANTNITNINATNSWKFSNQSIDFIGFCCNCKLITNAAVINSWSNIASANCQNMFRNCSNLSGNIKFNFNIVCAAYMFSNRANAPRVNIYASSNAYNAIYTAMGNAINNSNWNVYLYSA